MIDHTRNKIILATLNIDGKEKTVGLGQYGLNSDMRTADLALVVRDDYQNHGIGSELIYYLTNLAKRQGLLGFTGDALVKNQQILALIRKMRFEVKMENESGVFKVNLTFR